MMMMMMMTKKEGSDGKREGQRGRTDPGKESVLLQSLPVAVAASQRQYNHKTCFIFGIICGREKEMHLERRNRHNQIFLCYALLTAVIFLG